MMKKIFNVLLVLFILCSCKSYEVSSDLFDSTKPVHIIYTNMLTSDLTSENYINSLKTIKDDSLQQTPNVTLISTGNIYNENNGLYNTFIDEMNNINFDYATFGINDFKNGIDYVYQNIDKATFKFLACDLSYSGQIRDIFKKTIPFEVVDYDGIKIGYIGVTNPKFGENNPSYFYENNKMVVNFYNETPEVFYDTVQGSIDKAKKLGANYIVLISNLDTNDVEIDEDKQYYLIDDLVANTSNVDVVINGNEYGLPIESVLKSKDNKDVLVVSNGPSDTNYGKIILYHDYFSNIYFK